MYVIVVSFDLVPGRREAFLQLVTRNARLSLGLEPGCQVFDVLLPDDTGDRVVLYERYADRRAFDLHCASTHFAEFDAATKMMVARKSFIEMAPVVLPEAV